MSHLQSRPARLAGRDFLFIFFAALVGALSS
jgi:hypothetical protein